jgi:N-acetylglutamate synthase-like GNAT family acetyltransferase
MQDWSSDLTTRTGFQFHVRPAQPSDEPGLAEFFTHVTKEDLRFRFLTGIHEIGKERIAALVEVDHVRTENFLAFGQTGTPMIATAMLACDANLQRGEVAITIRDDYKHNGISWELLAHLARVAEAKGVKMLESIESRENHAAIDLEREMGFTVEADPDDPTLVIVRKKLAGA